MNYTTKKQSVIFELSLIGYLGERKIYRYNEETKRRERIGREYIISVQEKEEDLFDTDLNFYEYIGVEDEHEEEAKKYLTSKNYTPAEIELFSETLKSDIKKALNDAKESSYMTEWLTEYYTLTQKNIEDSISKYIRDFIMIDSLIDDEFKHSRTDQEYLRVEITKEVIKEYLKSENLKIDADYIETFISNTFDYLSAKEINTEYIDYYGTMGDYDGWLDYFKDYNEIESEIEAYRKDEADKIDNAERASLELKLILNEIDRYAAKYFTKEPTRQKIARQVTALKSVIKNAV